jgi:hypothetical protein
MMIINFILTATLSFSWATQEPRTIASDCLERALDEWERERGRLPTSEEADLLIEACVKEAFEKEPKSGPKSK